MLKKLRAIVINLPTIIVFMLNLLLFTYIGYGEASRTYLNFQLSKMITQADIIRLEFEPHIQAGLPLVQFSGFQGLSGQLLASDKTLENIQIINSRGERIFLNYGYELTPREFDTNVLSREYSQIKIDRFKDSKAKIERSDISYRVIVPLESKFGDEGAILLESLSTDLLYEKDRRYNFVFYALILFSLVFIIFNVLYDLFFARLAFRDRLVQYLYLVSFVLMLIIIGMTVFYIYEEGVQAQTKALSNSIVQRFNSILELGIDLDDIRGVNDVISDYKAQNPDIRRITLTKNNQFVYHTQEELIGTSYQKLKNTYEYQTYLSSGTKQGITLILSVDIPVNVVLNVVLVNAKNFLVLFLACGLIALIFLKAGTSFINLFDSENRRRVSSDADQELAGELSEEDSLLEAEFYEELEAEESVEEYRIGLDLIKPVYFLMVFVNALSISFLPKLVTEIISTTDSSLASASLPFTVFYILFAAVLLPAGQYAERGSLRNLMGVGFVFELIGLSILIATNNYWLFVIGRACSGVGQGLLLIGLQSYLLVIVPQERRTEAASVKVFGRNAALIAGASIGALLYSYIDYRTVFIIGVLLGAISLIYLKFLIPEVHSGGSRRSRDKSFRVILGNVGSVFKDLNFVSTFILIGLLGKMSITGVVMFAMPLLLERYGFAPEDIGQALMIYYSSSLITNHFVSRLVRKLGGTGIVLFISTLIGGVGMVLFGLIGVNVAFKGLGIEWLGYIMVVGEHINNFIAGSGISNLESYVILFCIFLTGISNGLLTAPIITRISNTKVALKKGYKAITATYTFLERGGHVLGPMFVSYLLFLTNDSQIAISIFGVLTLLLGLLFMVFALINKAKNKTKR